jgi:hypothetical protein
MNLKRVANGLAKILLGVSNLGPAGEIEVDRK